MKYLALLFLIIVCSGLTSSIAMADEASLAWFTDASISYSSKTAKPANAPPDAPGTILNGVSLTQSVGIDDPLLLQQHGMISFWIKPNWNGDDGLAHKFLSIGNTTSNGLLIDKTAAGTLRFLMASSTKTTACQADITSWQAGKWHHIVCSWIDQSNKPLGLCLWIDKVAVSSMVYGGDAFMNPSTMSDKKAYIGDTSSDAVMDELIFRGSVTGTYGPGQLDMIYRDYFRTAPYTSIKIDDQPNYVACDKRVVKNSSKQFGLMALMEGQWIRITDFAVRYGNWGNFDAKPFITWTSSSTSIATVDNSSSSFYRGRVTGKALGHCTLTATFRGMTATRDVEVIDYNLPDLDVMFVERLPRYSSSDTKKWPAEGEAVQSVVHVGNFGYTTLPAGSMVKFELVPDANHNFVCDADEPATNTQTATISQALAPKATTTFTFNWTWTMTGTFVRVTVDPNNTVSEICEANNQRCELNIARAFHWGYDTVKFDGDYNGKKLNLVGSYSDYDWCDAETDRMALVMRDAVCSTTSPVGIRDSIRVDQFTKRVYGDWDNEPWVIEGPYFDGGFPDMEPQNSTVMDIDAAIGHEIGHTTIWLPDIYGYPHRTYNVFLKDQAGQPYSNTKLYPEISAGYDPYLAPFTSAYNDHPDSLGVGYSALMIFCHLWLDEFCAGLSDRHAQTRSGLPWGDPGILIPAENKLRLYDINGDPLKGAAVYVTPVILDNGLPGGDTKYVPDRAKYIGNTDNNGYYTFPLVSDIDWDDPSSDNVDGSVSYWNPWRHLNEDAWSSSYTCGECLVVKIVSGTQTEFQWLPLTEANKAYMRGQTDSATYDIRTSLTSATGGTPIVRQVIPAAIKTQNQKPYAVLPALVTVKPGQTFTIDGSESFDPEGQPIYYRWMSPVFSLQSSITQTASYTEGDYEYTFYVSDGIRESNLSTTIVRVRGDSSFGGKVTDANGNPVANAIVGLKKSHYATADADYYFVTDADGKFTPVYVAPGSYYAAVWKDGYAPSADVAITIVYNTPLTRTLQLGSLQDGDLAAGITTVAASNSDTGAPTLATDGNFNTMWNTKYWPDEPVYYYVDLGASAEISDITLYRYYEVNDYGGPMDDYWVDVMTDGNPLDPAAWEGNSQVSNVYSATRTLHGYPILSNVAVDPIGIHLTNVRGLRIRMQGLVWPPDYRMAEIKVHGKFPPISGRVLDPEGNPLAGALVGFKTSAKATADTDTYILTDNQGRYSLTTRVFGTCNISAWKDGYCASDDTVINATGGATVPDITLARSGVNLILKTTKVAASSTYTTYAATKAVDANLTTNWRTTNSPSGAQYYYVDLGAKTDITDMVIYRYLERNSSGDSRDTYQIDVMTSATANPLTSSNWSNSANGVSTVYSATNTIHGYEIQPQIAVDPIRLSLTGVRGIRIKFTGYHYPRYYDLKELQVHQTATYRQVNGITDVKNANSGDYVMISGKILSALQGNGIPASTAYMEESDRSSGIRLDLSNFATWTAVVGNAVNARGLVTKTSDKEQCIFVTGWDYSTGQAVKPLLTGLKTLGGAPFGNQEGPWDYRFVQNPSSGLLELSFVQNAGLNNIGLLVKVCGKVTQIDNAGQYFYIDDGSGVVDGTKTGTVNNIGVRIPVDGRSYTSGRFLTIVGISSCFVHTDNKTRKLVRPITIQ